MKKIIITLLTFILMTGCGYTPIYSVKNFDFNIKDISKSKDDQLHLKVEKNLNSFSDLKSENIIDVKINVQKKINIITKDSRGDPSRYEMNIMIDLESINNKNQIKKKTFQENFNYNANGNKFELSQYERQIEDLLVNKCIEDIIVYLSTI